MSSRNSRKNKSPVNTTQNQQSVVATQQTVTHYQGDIPHPDILRGFDEIHPGTAQRLIDNAISQSNHRRIMEEKALNANIQTQQTQLDIEKKRTDGVVKSDLVGQVCGLIVSLACISGSIYTGINGYSEVAIALIAFPTAALIKAFFVSKK